MHESRRMYSTFHDTPGDNIRILYLQPLRVSCGRIALLTFLSLITGGLFLLLIWWFIKLRRVFIYSFCSIEEATHTFVVGEGNFAGSCRPIGGDSQNRGKERGLPFKPF